MSFYCFMIVLTINEIGIELVARNLTLTTAIKAVAKPFRPDVIKLR